MRDLSAYNKRITLGITAHVDSGKTTLSEALLFRCGEIRRRGRVDDGDSYLDTHETERARGITVFAHRAEFEIDGDLYTLLDTPGHVDFSSETERTFQVLDYAVLVISGTDGVQSHTETIWRLLEVYGVPTLIFINKMDIDAADKAAVLEDLQKRLSGGCVDFTAVFSDCVPDGFYEECAMLDDAAADEYLDGAVISDNTLSAAIAGRKIFPCLFGSALKMQGVDEFIELLGRFTAEPRRAADFGAKIYKISADDKGKRLTNLKVTGGTLRVRDSIDYIGKNGEQLSEKINEIRLYSGSKYETVDSAPAGTVCAVTGLTESFAGQGLGCEEDSFQPILEPVMTYSVELPDGVDEFKMLENLRLLEQEDPALHVIWNGTVGKIFVRLMGEVQLEILHGIIKDRFHADVSFGQGSVAYMETIADTVEGVGHYEPLRHYAEVHLMLEPLPRGEGLKFDNLCSDNVLDRSFQRLVLTHLEEKTHIGVLTGSPITDMKITLCSGRSHLKHTEGGDFRQAVYRAVRQGLRSAKSVLLEPYYNFTLILPSEYSGRAMTDIQQMNGEFGTPQTDGDNTVIKGTCPAAKMSGYQREVSGYTKGRGRLFCSFGGYTECADADAVIEKIGYNCDADIENSADSVFCAHGAGFNVKWDKVPEYMHLPSCIKTAKEEQRRVTSYRRAESFVDRAAEDKELMAIFERTYGKIDRDPRKAMATVKKPITYKSRAAVRMGPEYLLVDGYNIIFAWDSLRKLAAESLDAARNRLVNILCSYQGYRQCELILVFDAYKVPGGTRAIERAGNISIVYTKEKETADSYIEKVSHQLARDHRVRVATSDGAEQVIILGSGALRVSAAELLAEVEDAEKAVREYIEKMRNL
ncbi:MAG: TetM/TetW/TetO/TetS family tetracycline resistance ribosomal protection protein [Eubacterium sp.]|nr:TetM/TetW/TetO/TetS family tetracycline resistance ribosomal protection protein [Eubacterium sp.]